MLVLRGRVEGLRSQVAKARSIAVRLAARGSISSVSWIGPIQSSEGRLTDREPGREGEIYDC
jgi:hypothetical protein